MTIDVSPVKRSAKRVKDEPLFQMEPRGEGCSNSSEDNQLQNALNAVYSTRLEPKNKGTSRRQIM